MSTALLQSIDSNHSSDDEQHTLSINTDYAHKYNNWRRREELQKLKDKYGNHLDVLEDSDDHFDNSDTHSETDSQTSDHNEEHMFDHTFFKVYSALKSKHQSIYDNNIRFFDDQNEEMDKSETLDANHDTSQSQTQPKLTLKDYHKKLIIEKKGITDEDNAHNNYLENKSKLKGYYEELNDIRNEFKEVLNSDDSESEELVREKVKPSDDALHSTNILRKSDDKDLNFLSNYWENDSKLDECEKFLKDYILNKRYSQQNQVSYSKLNFDELNDTNEDIIDNNYDEKDVKNNDIEVNKFHFEEPDSNIIKRYPRSMNSIRDLTAKDNRSVKRTQLRERKKIEKDKQLKHLRKLKYEEMKDKLKTLREISGNEKIDINDQNLNILLDDQNDFDPSKYDQTMSSLFNETYYQNDLIEKRPKFEFVNGVDDRELEDYAIDSNISNDHLKSKQQLNKLKRKKNKQNSQFGVGFYEDLIGDLPTRYKYRVVEPNDFGLTDEEIMLADERELNKWCSIKKMSQYRNSDEEKYDLKAYSNKGSNLTLKMKILKSLYQIEDNKLIATNKKRKRRHRKPIFKVETIDSNINVKDEVKNSSQSNDTNSCKKAKSRNRKRKPKTQSSNTSISLERLKAYGLSNREIKKLNVSG